MSAARSFFRAPSALVAQWTRFDCGSSAWSATLEEARAAIAAYVETYHHRPPSALGYRTPKEVRETWEDAQESETSTKSRGLG